MITECVGKAGLIFLCLAFILTLQKAAEIS